MHDADVHRSKRIGTEALRPDVTGGIDGLSQLLEGWVEALDVPDLQRHAMFLGQPDEDLAFFARRSERLLHQHRDGSLQEFRGDVLMQERGDYDARGVDAAKQRP